MERQSIAWSDRDIGQKLSIVLGILAVGAMAGFVFVMSLKRLIAGPELFDRFNGAFMVMVILSFGYRGFRWWSARHAR